MPNAHFASDNAAPVDPIIWTRMGNINKGYSLAYGDDEVTREALDQFQQVFGVETSTYMVFGGTGANVLSLQAMLQPHEAVICAQNAHINLDECGAPEKIVGCKLIPLETPDGKLTQDMVRPHFDARGDEHAAQPKVVSITQPTEYGTVYTLDELTALADEVHKAEGLLHMDGARLYNAAIHLDCSLEQASYGPDMLSLGGTKNGMMYGEAVVVLNSDLDENMKFLRKQTTQLPSKMKYIAVQFTNMLNPCWYPNATNANQTASLLAEKIQNISEIEISQPVQTNAIFAHMPSPKSIAKLQEKYDFYVWEEAFSEVRWMTNWSTTEEDVTTFAAAIRESVA